MKRDKVALVDESRCIGCTLCIAACPVDAIVGAQSLMHTVVEPWCIGCGLCLPPCPVDCIAMVPRASLADTPPAPTARDNRERLGAHNARIAGRARRRAALLTARKQAAGNG